jgi:hypothetical protein
MRNHNPLLAAVLLALLFAAVPIVAMQTAAGSISGTVKDPAGAVVTGAQVSIRNDTTGDVRNTSANAEEPVQLITLLRAATQ